MSISKSIVAIFLYGLGNIAYADTFVHEDIITDPVPSRFNICHGGTCEELAAASLDKQQWQSVRKIFSSNESAEQERQNIRLAIARMETIVGKKTDTYNDKGENKTDEQLNHYLDCIDESTNTSLYLIMMQKDGLIRMHTVEDRETRGYFFNGWPHTTAVIRENQSQKRYAVDSWFLDNGKKPFIIPLNEWASGWRPKGKDTSDH